MVLRSSPIASQLVMKLAEALKNVSSPKFSACTYPAVKIGVVNKTQGLSSDTGNMLNADDMMAVTQVWTSIESVGRLRILR